MKTYNFEDIDKFGGKLIKLGNSLAVIVPANIVKCNRWKIGQRLRIYLRKDND